MADIVRLCYAGEHPRAMERRAMLTATRRRGKRVYYAAYQGAGGRYRVEVWEREHSGGDYYVPMYQAPDSRKWQECHADYAGILAFGSLGEAIESIPDSCLGMLQLCPIPAPEVAHESH